MLRIFFIAIFIAIAVNGHSQISIRVMPLETFRYLDTPLGDGPRGCYNVGLGLMHQTKNNLALSVDYKFDIARSLSDEYFYVSTDDFPKSYSSTYSVQVSELMYKSSYLFSSNTVNSFYVGSGIGIRWHALTADVEIYDDNAGFSSKSIQAFRKTHPLAFYCGLMTENDGGFTDFYLGYTINMGSGADWKGNLDEYGIRAPLVAGGFVFGISWNFCPANL
jgi:hypothetical protein